MFPTAAPPGSPGDSSDIQLPPLFRRHVHRPRLTALLDQARAHILLIAPAGYGKTTLAAEWLQSRHPNEVAWYDATTADADVAGLALGIASAISDIVPVSEESRKLIRAPQPPSDPASTYAQVLAQDLAAWPSAAWLVIDDYHELHLSPSERLIELLIEQTPIQLLIATRVRPAWATARRQLYGETLELGADQLRMTDDEVEAVLGAQTDHSALAGWPVIVGLAATSTRSVENAEDRQAAFRFFAEEILAQHSERERDLLLASSVGPYVTQGLLSAVADVNVSGEAFSVLLDSGLLHERADIGCSLHPLLREFLREWFRAHHPEAVDAAVQRCCAHLAGEARWDDALGVAADFDRLDLAEQLLETCGLSLLATGRIATVEAWASRFALRRRASPVLLRLQAEAFVRRGLYADAEAVARHVLPLLSEDEERSRMWVLIGRANHLLCNEQAALDAYTRAFECATSPELRAEAAWGQLVAAADLEAADLGDRLQQYEQLALSSAEFRMRLAAGRHFTALVQGSVRNGDGELRRALALVPLAQDPMVVSTLYNAASCEAMLLGLYSDSLEYAEEGLEYCRQHGLDFALAHCLGARAQAYIGLARFSRAKNDVLELESHLGHDPHLVALYWVTLSKLRLTAGGSVRLIASRTARHVASPHPNAGAPYAELLVYRALEDLSSGLTSSARGRSADALKISVTAVARAGSAVIPALADAIDRPAQGTRRLESALALADELGCVDFLLVTQHVFPKLLATYSSPSLDASLRTPRSLGSRSENGVSRALADRGLTKREMEVADLIAGGLSNREIARRLVIEMGTVKVHVRRVLRKLGAANRLEAALLVRDLSDSLTRPPARLDERDEQSESRA
jgi:DNA-binding NarL/FixJ family response regulator/tetratricopeptide (TPR) repeat protein